MREACTPERHDVIITHESGEEMMIGADSHVWARDRELLLKSEKETWSLNEFLETPYCNEYIND